MWVANKKKLSSIVFSGAGIMSKFRKLQLEIPKSLHDDIEKIAALQELKTEEIVKKALKNYIRNFQKLKAGYEDMAEFNQEYAEMCLSADNEALAVCEEKLSESEKCDC